MFSALAKLGEKEFEMSDDYYRTTKISSLDPMSSFYHGYNAPEIKTSTVLFDADSRSSNFHPDDSSTKSARFLPSKGLVFYYIALALVSAFAAPYIFN